MIALAHDCLVFQLSSGEKIPFSVDMISVELMGETAGKFDTEFVKNAAASVFHHFKHDLDRESVTVGEFASALEKILRKFNATVYSQKAHPSAVSGPESDLNTLAGESGEGCELVFYPRLRNAMRVQLRRSPQPGGRQSSDRSAHVAARG